MQQCMARLSLFHDVYAAYAGAAIGPLYHQP